MSFNRSFCLTLTVILLCLGLFSVAIDPYGAFRTPAIEGLNRYKLTALNFMRLVKPYQVNWLDYEVLITGSSRAGRGLDCGYFLARGERCYNSALVGGGIYEAYRFLQQRPEGLQRAIVTLDFFLFLQEEDATDAFVEERLLRAPDGKYHTAYPAQAINDLFGLLFSRQTLKASRNTRKWQHLPAKNHRADGMLYLDNLGGWDFDAATLDPAKPNLRINRQVLRYENVLSFMQDYYEFYARDRAATRQNIHRQMSFYRQLLDLLYQNESQASLILPPSHASYWLLLRRWGFYKNFEQWKRNLVRINEEVALKYARQPLAMFDFSGLNAVALSAPPLRNRPASMNGLFTDAMHFSRTQGNRMLDRALGACDNRGEDLFGYCITSANIGGLLRRQRELLQHWEADSPVYLKSAYPASAADLSRQ